MEQGAQQDKMASARAWLAEQLADGRPHILGGLLLAGYQAGHKEQTIRRAAKALRVVSTPAKHAGINVLLWSLPTRA